MECAGKQYIQHNSRSNVFSIWSLSDIHLGNKACNIERIKDDVKRIQDDLCSFWFGGGDYGDYISPKDKRWAAGELSEDISVKDLSRIGAVIIERVRDLFMPIKHKCLGLLLGNHEAKYMGHNEQANMHAWLCQELGALNLDYCAFVDVVFARNSKFKRPMLTRGGVSGGIQCTKRFLLHHGFGGAITPGGKLNSLIKAMQSFEADVYMMGHVHDQKGQRQVRLKADASCRNLIAHQSVGVITGSYLATYARGCCGYGEQKGYAPTPLGAVRVQINPETGEVRGEV